MSIINLIILSLLILNSTSLDDIDKSDEDRQKCEQINDSGEVTDEKCISITQTLESTGQYKGECCRISYKTDPLAFFKKIYGEQWKTIVCQMYGFDENISQKDLLKIFGMKDEEIENNCIFLNPDVIKAQLYSFSSFYETDINYNCGNGEDIYNAKDFIPSTDLEKKYKDVIDCHLETNEKSCSKKPYKLLTDEVQCCWCELTEEGIGSLSTTISCNGYPIEGLEEEIKKTINKKESNENQVTYKCSCFNKNGKNTKVSANSITGEIIIE